MAKQSSLFKLRGKADGQSFYYSKNGEYLTRKINPGMSSRVKTAEEYANTRLNNAEFGGAGNLAGTMIRTVSKRWRYILNSIATGMLVKGIKEAMMNDNTHDWGKRSVLLADMPAIQDLYNRFSKNEMPQEIVDFVKAHITSAGNGGALTVDDDLELTGDLNAHYAALGADKVKCTLFCFGVSAPAVGADGEKYAPALPVFSQIASETPRVGEGVALISNESYANIPAVQNVAAAFGGVLVIVEPIKTINSVDYVLQQHCSAYWHSVATTA